MLLDGTISSPPGGTSRLAWGHTQGRAELRSKKELPVLGRLLMKAPCRVETIRGTALVFMLSASALIFLLLCLAEDVPVDILPLSGVLRREDKGAASLIPGPAREAGPDKVPSSPRKGLSAGTFRSLAFTKQWWAPCPFRHTLSALHVTDLRAWGQLCLLFF